MLTQLRNLLADSRNAIVGDWVKLLHDSSDSYRKRQEDELIKTCNMAYEGFLSHIMENRTDKLDLFIDFIVAKRLKSNFSTSEVQFAFGIFRKITTPLVLSRLSAESQLFAIETIDKTVSYSIATFSEKYQNKIDEEILKINCALSKSLSDLQAEKNIALEANRMKDQFLANISHELLTPLTSIIGYSKMILAHQVPNKVSLDKVKVIYDQGKLLQHHINTLLLISQINAGQMKKKNDKIEVKELLERCIEEALSFLPLNNCKINLYSEGIPHLITADGEKLRFAVYELIFNAIKFSRSDSSVDVTCSFEPGFVKISVKDIGIGINTENLETIFSPFFQVDGSHTRCYGGSGLGLAMIRKVAELHNGSVRVESTPGSGSLFTFEIPYLQAHHH